MIKYSIQIPEDRLDKYCNLLRAGRREVTEQFKQIAEVHGRTAVFEKVENTLDNKQEKLK
jgi:hypothetical protein